MQPALKNQPDASPSFAPAPSWVFSPDPAVEEALHAIRLRHPPLYPALGRPRRLLEKLGNPHQQLPFVFHVAGTNGKGSTLAFLQAIFEAGGLSVHKNISPHLVRFEERITIAGKMITPGQLLALIDEGTHAAGGEDVSFFEFFTALAFLAFARYPAAAVLLETGLGGLHDATNVIGGDRLVSLLTRISHDHNRILGATLPEIAAHKAGIIKPGCSSIIAPQPEQAVTDVFLRQAEAVKAPAYLCGRDWMVAADDAGFEYKSAARCFRLPLPQLQGRHQVYNAGVALAALGNSPYAFLLEQGTLERAMQGVNWPGRLQQITEGPLAALLPLGWELWLDGAHNDSGAETLVQQAQLWGKEKPLHLVTAMKKGKDGAGFYRPLLPYMATVQALDAQGISAPMLPAEELCDQVQGMGYTHVKPAANLESAVRALVSQFQEPQRILITGSLYLAGHVLKEYVLKEQAY